MSIRKNLVYAMTGLVCSVALMPMTANRAAASLPQTSAYLNHWTLKEWASLVKTTNCLGNTDRVNSFKYSREPMTIAKDLKSCRDRLSQTNSQASEHTTALATLSKLEVEFAADVVEVEIFQPRAFPAWVPTALKTLSNGNVCTLSQWRILPTASREEAAAIVWSCTLAQFGGSRPLFIVSAVNPAKENANKALEQLQREFANELKAIAERNSK